MPKYNYHWQVIQILSPELERDGLWGLFCSAWYEVNPTMWEDYGRLGVEVGHRIYPPIGRIWPTPFLNAGAEIDGQHKSAEEAVDWIMGYVSVKLGISIKYQRIRLSPSQATRLVAR